MESGGGRGVIMFAPENGIYISNDKNITLDGAFLFAYGKDWVLQEALDQHAVLKKFCPTSVNTMRINTYRSYEDENIYIISGALRIGQKGKVVDNGHAGGGLIGINMETGELGDQVVNERGDRYTEFNGIDFANKKDKYVIPNWEHIKSFCKEVAQYNKHCRLLSLDVALTKEGLPMLIEWNVAPFSFSYWIPMYTGAIPFGDKTEEIIKYCKNR